MKEEKFNHRVGKKQISLVTLHIPQKNRIKSMEVTANADYSHSSLFREKGGVRAKQQSSGRCRGREMRDSKGKRRECQKKVGNRKGNPQQWYERGEGMGQGKDKRADRRGQRRRGNRRKG